MAGGVGVPTPWWTIPGPVGRSPADALANLQKNTPPGYTYDPVKQDYVPIAGSATDVLSQRAKLESFLGIGGTGTGTGLGAGLGTGTGTSADVGFTYPGSSSGGTSFPSVPYGGGPMPGVGDGPRPTTPAQIPTVQAPDTSAAQAAIFGRAKDQVGQESSGALAALRSALAARGIAGSGLEVKGTANVISKGQQQLGDTTREQAIQEATRQNDFAKLGYQGAIEQRGQDITTSEGAANRALEAANTQFQGGITERGQDIGATNEAANRALDAAKTAYLGQVTQRGQTLSAQTGRLNATDALLSKLY
jgi:hypothetical protein